VIVRKAQFAIFRESATRDFEDRSMAHLRSRFPQKLTPTSEDDLRAFLRSGMAKAGVYGIVNEGDVARYFEYMVEYGADFDTALGSSWAAPILTSLKSGFEKMNELDDFTTFELR
jgi:hypothetical protein